MNKKMYKVVREVEGRYFSACVNVTGLETEYFVGDTISPSYGKAFCFEKLEQAIAFARSCNPRLYGIEGNIRIFHAVAYGISKCSLIIRLRKDFTIQSVIAFFQKKQKDLLHIEVPWKLSDAPKGTFLARTIKLTEEVFYDRI
jgi:hypothetical protein